MVVDVQRGLVEGGAAVSGAAAFTARIDEFLGRARAAGVPVVHLQDDGSAPGALVRRGSEGWELALGVADGEAVLPKAEDDGFRDTDLHQTLQSWGADRLVVVGIQSEMCVAATARGALDRGYAVVLPREGHTTYDIPADEAGGAAVPAALVARVAEWSLGDTVELPQSLDEVAWT
ncbi:isochorismatase [Nocardioides flavus (ex Wang et al. 2016)]|uniref:Isochorismatase n=1 Tax=Nocardioides flavus (ex Wang et al. 2016) TaxID=2058780 RepID=A0ABQ3HM02_9ACTN|nr:isochorismatase [Nocardioides flavus (ex Wang et al. 2016)]